MNAEDRPIRPFHEGVRFEDRIFDIITSALLTPEVARTRRIVVRAQLATDGEDVTQSIHLFFSWTDEGRAVLARIPILGEVIAGEPEHTERLFITINLETVADNEITGGFRAEEVRPAIGDLKGFVLFVDAFLDRPNEEIQNEIQVLRDPIRKHLRRLRRSASRSLGLMLHLYRAVQMSTELLGAEGFFLRGVDLCGNC